MNEAEDLPLPDEHAAPAEAFVAGEQEGKAMLPETCLNCGATLRGAFCHDCGQKNIPKRQTLAELWINFISSFWSYEGKFFRTTRYLITKPGFLALEYNAGKRERYYHPARMYVFISFVFFFVFFSLPDSDESEGEKVALTTEQQKEFEQKTEKRLEALAKIVGDSAALALGDSIRKAAQEEIQNNGSGKNEGVNLDLSEEQKYKSVAEYDSLQLAKPEAERDNWLERRVTRRLIEVLKENGNNSNKLGELFVTGLKDSFSKVLFYLLPFFALLLKLLYIRRGFYYSEHLVFSIYYYNFFYLAGTIQLLIQQVPWLSWISPIVGFWILFYLLFAMKRTYQQRWRKTIVKYLIFVFVFMFLAAIAFGISAVAVLLFM
jgi:hypothetical protein